MVEACAMKKGIQMALDLDLCKIIIESDCQRLINVINQVSKLPDWRCDVVLDVIQNLKSGLLSYQFRWIGRSANSGADWQAKLALHGMCRLDWVSGPPSPFLALIPTDATAVRSGIG